MESIIKVECIEKKFLVKGRDVHAVNKISFEAKEGEKVGYVGLNGAGKSTTIKMLTGLVAPTSGEINILGFRPFEQRKKYVSNIGVVFGQRNQLFWDLRVEDSFLFHQKLYGISKAEYRERLEFFNQYVDLASLMNKNVLKLSLGQKMLCNVTLSLLHNPKILFLDEPTIGLDIFVKEEIQNLLNQINRCYNTNILFTSHDMKDIENICDRIIILEKGKILEDMQILEFNREYGGTKSIVLNKGKDLPLDVIFQETREAYGERIDLKLCENNKSLCIRFKENEISLMELLNFMDKTGRVNVESLVIRTDSLEDAIKNIYQRGK
ncbi:MAG: ABC transporter ATP-binding protein [Filifactoraceae bacterium]